MKRASNDSCSRQHKKSCTYQVSALTSDGFSSGRCPAGDGTIDFNEFLGLMKQLKADVSQAEDDLVDVFRVLDQDGDGYISQADLRDIIVR